MVSQSTNAKAIANAVDDDALNISGYVISESLMKVFRNAGNPSRFNRFLSNLVVLLVVIVPLAWIRLNKQR